uniref:ABC transporter domain-containing protein n=1 Tax=Vitis vinifera TaxID=29760 RepID=F6H1T1_VITVI
MPKPETQLRLDLSSLLGKLFFMQVILQLFPREGVEQLLLESSEDHAIICDLDTLEKIAMRGLSLALSHGECFGMFGPNGADKNYFISMLIGLTAPTSDTAFVEGLDIRTHIDGIYTSMGVCPQHNLL